MTAATSPRLRPSPETAEQVKAAETVFVSTEAQKAAADKRLADKRDLLYVTNAEVNRLRETMTEDTEADIQRYAVLTAKVPLIERSVASLEKEAAQHEVPLTEAKAAFRAVIAKAVDEIATAQMDNARPILRTLTADPGFVEFAVPRIPEIVAKQKFAIRCRAGAVENELQLSLPTIAERVLKGDVPTVNEPQLPSAGLIALSAQPVWQPGGTGFATDGLVARDSYKSPVV
jgi:hypothetical protein